MKKRIAMILAVLIIVVATLSVYLAMESISCNNYGTKNRVVTEYRPFSECVYLDGEEWVHIPTERK